MDTRVYEYFLHKSDFIAAQQLYLRHNKRAAFTYYFWVWLVPILGVVVCLIALTAHLLGQEAIAYQLRPLAALGLWLAVAFPAVRWWNLRKLWRVSCETMDSGKPVNLQFDNEMLISAIPGKSEGRFYWNAIIDYAVNSAIAMIFIQKKRFLYIPKNALPEEAWVRIRSLAPRKR